MSANNLALLLVLCVGCSSQWPPADRYDDVDGAGAAKLQRCWECASQQVLGGPTAIVDIQSLLESRSDEGRTSERLSEVRWVTPREAMIKTYWSSHDDGNAVTKGYLYVVRSDRGRWVVLNRYLVEASYACG